MKTIYKLIFFLFFLLIVSPYFGSLDVIAPQWLYLSILNFIVFLFIFYKHFHIPKSYIFYLYSLFICQVILSLFYANNLNVAIVDATRFLIIFLTTYNLYLLLQSESITFRFISVVLSFFLFSEVLYSSIPFFSFFIVNPINLYDQFSTIYSENLFLGFAGNKNITAASIAIKLPFLIYLIFTSKYFKNILFVSLFSLSVLVLYFLRARSVYLSFSFVLSLFLLFSIFFKKIQYSLIIVSVFIMGLFSSFLTTSSNNSNPIVSDIESISFSASSSSDRFLLWDNALSYIADNLFIGCGIGNWKIESLPYWNTHLSNYIVPYHAHNDLLEITTELGLLGGITYLTFYMFLFFTLFLLIFYNRNKFNISLKFFVVLTSLVVFFIDLLLNFPHERPRMQIVFALLVSLIMFFSKKYKFRS